MKYTTNGVWSDSAFPRDGWAKVRVMRDDLGRPCDCKCGRTPKYVHEMMHPTYGTILVGCTCHAQLLGVPYAEAKTFENAFKKAEKARIKLEKQQRKEEEHELIVVNGGMCPLGMRCPHCKEAATLVRQAEMLANKCAAERWEAELAEWDRTKHLRFGYLPPTTEPKACSLCSGDGLLDRCIPCFYKWKAWRCTQDAGYTPPTFAMLYQEHRPAAKEKAE